MICAGFQRRQGNSPSNELNTAAASANVDPVFDNTPLADDYETEFLKEAYLQFPSERTLFVRLRKKEGPKTVTLAVEDGQLSQIVILANLIIRAWDSKSSYYTLDHQD